MLQIKEIPPRPAEFDGKLCLFGIAEHVGEVQVREALGNLEADGLGFEVGDVDTTTVSRVSSFFLFFWLFWLFWLSYLYGRLD